MHFCSNCENLYYIRIDSEDTNQLIYYCRHCGKEDNNGVGSNSIIYKSTSNSNQINPNKLINKYTKLDPTLPRITNMLCPNENCITNIRLTANKYFLEKIKKDVSSMPF